MKSLVIFLVVAMPLLAASTKIRFDRANLVKKMQSKAQEVAKARTNDPNTSGQTQKPPTMLQKGARHDTLTLDVLQQRGAENSHFSPQLLAKVHAMAQVEPVMMEGASALAASGTTLEDVGSTFWDLLITCWATFYNELTLHQHVILQLQAEHANFTSIHSHTCENIELDKSAIAASEADKLAEETNRDGLEARIDELNDEIQTATDELSDVTNRCRDSAAYYANAIDEHQTSLVHLRHVKELVKNFTKTGGRGGETFDQLGASVALHKAAQHTTDIMYSSGHQELTNKRINDAIFAVSQLSSEDQVDYQANDIKAVHLDRLLEQIQDIIDGTQDSLDLFIRDRDADHAQCEADKNRLNEQLNRAGDELTNTQNLHSVSVASIAAHASTIQSRQAVLASNEAKKLRLEAAIAANEAEQEARNLSMDGYTALFYEEVGIFEEIFAYIGEHAENFVPGECHEESVDCPRCKVDEDCDDGIWCNGAETCNQDSHICQRGWSPDLPCGLVENCHESTHTCGCPDGQHPPAGAHNVASHFSPVKGTKLDPNPQDTIAAMSTAHDYSYCMWIKPNSAQEEFASVFSRSDSSEKNWAMYPGMFMYNGYIYVFYGSGHDMGDQTWSQYVGLHNTQLPIGEWSHVCISISQQDATAQILANDAGANPRGGFKWWVYMTVGAKETEFWTSPDKIWDYDYPAADVEVAELEFYDYALSAIQSSCRTMEGAPGEGRVMRKDASGGYLIVNEPTDVGQGNVVGNGIPSIDMVSREYTYAFFVNVKSLDNTWHNIFNVQPSDASGSYPRLPGIWLNRNKKFHWSVSTSNTNNDYHNSDDLVVLNERFFVAFTVSDSNHETIMYTQAMESGSFQTKTASINGDLQVDETATIYLSERTSHSPLDGSVDKLKFWPKVLTAEEVQAYIAEHHP